MPTQSGPTLFSQSISSHPKPLLEPPPTSTVSLAAPALALAPLPPPPPNEGGIDLPLNWKTAHDQTGLLKNICIVHVATTSHVYCVCSMLIQITERHFMQSLKAGSTYM